MRRLPRTFTLLELLTVLGIIAVGAAILLPVVIKAKAKSSQITCMNNVRNLSLGIQMFYNQSGTFPHGRLKAELQDLLSGGDEIFTCPSSGEPYDDYYVAREHNEQDRYFLGCPRHKIINYAPGKGTATATLGAVLKNGAPGEAGQNLSAGDTLQLADGSTVTVNAGEAKILACFWKASGGLYTILRILEDGSGSETSLDVKVTEGANADLEVVTPAAIAGVVGTEFEVHSRWNPTDDTYETDLSVSKGAVKLTGRKGTPQWEPVLVKAGESQRKKSSSAKVHKDKKEKKDKKEDD